MQILIIKANSNKYNKGDIVEIRATGTPFGGAEPDIFVLVEVVDEPMTDYENLNSLWKRIIDFEVISNDKNQDDFRLRLFSSTANSTTGKITKNEIESFINSWSGTVFSFGDNEVTFDINVYGALVSPAFWEIDISQVGFTELSYNKTTGIHRIQADCSSLGNNPTYVERYVRQKGCTIVSHAGKMIVYDIARSDAVTVFENDLKRKADKLVAIRRYYIDSATVDYIIAQGGFMQTDLATFLTYLKDKQTD